MKLTLTAGERLKWNRLLDDANKAASTTRARGEKVLELLDDAEQAHEPWVAKIRHHYLISGASKSAKDRLKATSTTDVAFKKSTARRPTAVGIRRSDDDGRSQYQQTLFVDMDWPEVRQHRAMVRRQIRELGITAATDTKVLELQELVPDSKGPGDACRQLGITMVEYLQAVAS